jgi:hypothetical protein
MVVGWVEREEAGRVEGRVRVVGEEVKEEEMASGDVG